MVKPTGTTPPAATVFKALRVLSVIGGANEPLEFREVAKLARVPKPTLHRLLAPLLEYGLVRYEPEDQTYRLGFRLMSLAQKAWLDGDLHGTAERKLIQLGLITGEQAQVGLLDGMHVVYLNKRDTPNEIRVFYGDVGRLPVHCTAVGKVLLAFMPEDEREALLATVDTTRYTPNTIDNVPALRLELAAIRERGYAIDDEEHNVGVRGLAAPMFDFDSTPRLAIGISGPAFRLTDERCASIAPDLVEIARKPAPRFGGAPLYSKVRESPPRAPNHARCALASTAFMGDSPVWSVTSQTLYWVDILAPSLQKFQPGRGASHIAQPPHAIGAVALTGGDRLLLVLQTGFFFYDMLTGSLEPLGDPEAHLPENRFNDAKVDRRGRLFAGTMQMTRARGMGSLYRLDPDLTITKVDSGFDLCNGIAWSLDDRRMYVSDSVAHKIYVYDFDPDDGVPKNRRVFADIPDHRGEPGGLTVDSEDHVWASFWDGWCVQRFSPDGAVRQVVSVPVPRPTSVTFGGPKLETLFMTSARIRMSSQQLIQAPLSGSLFAIEPGVSGVREPTFGGGLPTL